jgi:hypothetical protein
MEDYRFRLPIRYGSCVLTLVMLHYFHVDPFLAGAEELPLTRNIPIPDFQNRTSDTKTYDFDAPPEGMFRSIVLSETFEEEMGFQRTHEIVPVRPTDQVHRLQTSPTLSVVPVVRPMLSGGGSRPRWERRREPGCDVHRAGG